MDSSWFSEVTEKKKGIGIVNANREVNYEVNDLATERAEAQILKGYVCMYE